MKQGRSKKITKLLSCVAIILCMVIFSSSVFATEPVNAKDAEINNQNQQVQPYAVVNFTHDGTCYYHTDAVTKYFNTGDNKYLTASASARLTSGSATKVRVKLQKWTMFGWLDDRIVEISITGSSQTVLNGYPIDKNTNYRFTFQTISNDASAYVYIAAQAWQ